MTTTLTPQSATAAAAASTTDSCRGLLEAQRVDCLRQRELALAEAATALPDPVATRRAASLRLTLEEIDAALHRVAVGTYGLCVDCGVDIPAERLEFRPSAAACVDCQAASR